MRSPKIKICGLTKPEEADFLNQVKADYAGFVFFEKSKRNVTFPQAKEILSRLSSDIKRVAVTVSPDVTLCRKIEEYGFDILQVHGELKPEVLEQSGLPIWRACNIENTQDLKRLEHHEKITAYVVDAKTAGSGQTFDWQSSREAADRKEYYFHGKGFVLAGGLHSGNVTEGIELFQPDVVDVSSGVERSPDKTAASDMKKGSDEKTISKVEKGSSTHSPGKDGQLILDFVKQVRLSTKAMSGAGT